MMKSNGSTGMSWLVMSGSVTALAIPYANRFRKSSGRHFGV
jgi:hypothetical protein